MTTPYSPHRVSYVIEDNESVLNITVDGQPVMANLEIMHNDQGFYIEDSFSPSEEEIYGKSRLDRIKILALAELNIFHEKEVADKNFDYALPKLAKDAVQGVIRLKETYRNKAGDVFPAGHLMIITKRNKKSKTVELRPIKGNIILDEDAIEFLGNKVDLGFDENQ